MDKKWGLAKAFIISFIVIVCIVISIAWKMNSIGKNNEVVFVIQEFKYIPLEYMEEYLINMIIINNINYIIKLLIFLVIGIFLIILLVAHCMKIEKENKIKQIRNLIFVTLISIVFLFSINIVINIQGEKIHVPISMILEFEISENDKEKIENILNETDGIIEYKHISSEERFRKNERYIWRRNFIRI